MVTAVSNQKYVVVTTEYKGVFFGLLVGIRDGTATLEKARNCLYWSQDVRGVFGLAATGPTPSCRIGPEVPSLIVMKMTSLAEATPDAVKAWQAAPWRV